MQTISQTYITDEVGRHMLQLMPVRPQYRPRQGSASFVSGSKVCFWFLSSTKETRADVADHPRTAGSLLSQNDRVSRCKINPSFTPSSHSHGMSFAAATSPNVEQAPRTNSVAHNADHKEEEAWSGDEDEDADGDVVGGDDDSRKRKRQRLSSRPLSVSCELCKSRKVSVDNGGSIKRKPDAFAKVKCDRGQPRCGWCVRNGQNCEYKERKKPGLRAGYGRELESRLGRPSTIAIAAWNPGDLQGPLLIDGHGACG